MERRRRRLSSADGGRVPQMAAELSAVDGQAQCRRWRPAQPGQCEFKSNPIKLLQEKCGEEMKCDTNSGNCWSSSRRPQRWQCRTWTKIRENSRKGTLNASSDIFARCSKLQTEGTSSEVFLRLDYPYAWDVVDQVGRYKCAVFFPLNSSTAGPFPQGHRDTVFFPLTCQNARNNTVSFTP